MERGVENMYTIEQSMIQGSSVLNFKKKNY